jgi:hypothetical protein
MARKKKVEEEVIKDDDLLGTEVVVEVKEPEVVAEISPKKEKELLGYHPITGEEIWQ